MAKENTIKTIFAIDGETRYRDAIKSINSEQSLLRAEMGKVDAAYKNNGDAIQLNRDKIKILNSQIELQTQKVNEAKNALEQAKKAQDPEAITKYSTEVARAEAGLGRMEAELKKANAELEKQQNKLVQAGKSITEWGEKWHKAGEKMTKVGNTLSKTVTAPLMALGTLSAKAAIDFETAMTGVRKTTELTDVEFAAMSQSIRDMAKDIPITTTELGAIAEAAGQLGIKKENILGFTRTIADLGVSSNLTGDEGAMMLAKFANITQMDQSNFDRLGSVIIDLGNNTATTEKDIAAMATGIAAAGKQAGMSEADIMSYAAALSAAGMEAQAGGTAISKVISEIQLAVETGGESLVDFASVAGMSVDDFSRAFREDAAGALATFITGLNDTERNGQSAIQILENMGIKEVRVRQALLRLAGAGDTLTDAIAMGNLAWEENNALTHEAEMFYGTTANQLLVQKNRMNDVAITLGQMLIPHLTQLMEWLTGLVEKFGDLNPKTQETIVKIAGLAAVIGPLLSIGGKLTTGVTSLAKGVGGLVTKIGAGGLLSVLTGPVGVVALLGLAAGAIAYFSLQTDEATEAIKAYDTAVSTAKTGLENQYKATDIAAGSALYLTGIVEDLAAKENKSATEKQRLIQYIAELNKAIPGLSLSYDENTDSLNMSTEAIRDNIQAMIDAAYAAAQMEYLNELIEAHVALEMERADLINKQAEAWAKLEPYNDRYQQYLEDIKGLDPQQAFEVRQGYVDIRDLIGDFEDVSDAIGRLDGKLAESGEGINEYADQMQIGSKKIVDANESVASSAEDSAERQEEAAKGAAEATSEYGAQQIEDLRDLEAEQTAYRTALEAAVAKHNRIMGGLEDGAVEKSKLTTAELIANWNAQADDYEAWSLAMQGIAGRVPQGLYDELKEAGPKILPALEEMNLMSQDQLDQMSAAWIRKTELAVDGAAAELAHMPGAAGEEGKKTVQRVKDELFKLEAETKKEGIRSSAAFSTAFGSKAPDAMSKAQAVRLQAQTGVSGGNFYGTGQQAGASYASGVASQYNAAYNSGWSIAGASIAGIKARNVQRSPSKILTALGDQAGESYVGGFARNIDDAEKVGDEMAKTMQDSLSDVELKAPGLDAQIEAARQSSSDFGALGGGSSIDKSRHNSMIVNIQVSDGATIETGKNVARGFIETMTRERIARGEPA